MALETGTYISSLNASNPASTDGLAQADDHIRLLKSTIKSTLPNVTGAITATQLELNLMDGVTATTAELNTLDGITSTVAELNILDGVTASTTELNITDGLTATTAELNKLDGVTASTAELNLVDGLTATTAELNYVDGVTSNIQTQLNTSATNLSNLSGVANTVWETGTSTTDSLVNPAAIKAAILELSPIKAWINFDGNGTGSGTPNIRSSSGIASITRNNTGDFTVTFETGLMPDANYVLLGTAGHPRHDNRASLESYQLNQTTCRFTVTNHGNLFRSQVDYVNVAFVR